MMYSISVHSKRPPTNHAIEAPIDRPARRPSQNIHAASGTYTAGNVAGRTVVNHSSSGWLNISGSPGCGRDQSCVVNAIGPMIFWRRGGHRRGAVNHVGRADTPPGGTGSEERTGGVC